MHRSDILIHNGIG